MPTGQKICKKLLLVKNGALGNEVQFLGTEILKITWKKIERRLTDVEDERTHLVPFKAEAPEGKGIYYGMYYCKEGYVEYANE